jgi:peptide/nickel transport system substrate-binding protein
MRRTKIATAAFAAILAGTIAACGATPPSASGGTGATANSVLTISNENGATWTCGFNPFNGSDTLVSVGFAYEPLVYVNPLQNGATTPMLATAWAYGPGDKSLTFTIRNGVKFSDGVPMTAADVAYTFNLIRKYSALDLTGMGAIITKVSTSGNQVTLDFNTPAASDFYYIADQTPIVPEHIWSKVANPVTWSNSDPIGTGPYVVNPCTKENITYTPNKYYWQPGEPHIKKIEYPAFLTNDAANEELANGQAQWGAQYIPDIQTYYSAKSSAYHYWFPPVLNVSVVPNLTNPLLANVKVREAISYALDRSKVSSIGESGYEPPANQSGVVTPTFNSWEDTSALAAWGSGYDPSKAIDLLKQAGYHLGSNGVMVNAKGQQLSFSIINIGDYSDWVASMQVIQQELKAVGIAVSPDNLTNTTYEQQLYTGKFQLAYVEQQTFGPGPFYELANWLNSANTAPIGQTAATNYERYSSAATDKLIGQYAATTDTATQHSIVDQLEQVMLTDVPMIPVVEGVDWYQYDTSGFTGWPTASDPYAQPPAWAYPDNEQVLLRLQPTK